MQVPRVVHVDDAEKLMHNVLLDFAFCSAEARGSPVAGLAHNDWHKILYLLLIFKRVEDQILRHFERFELDFVKWLRDVQLMAGAFGGFFPNSS